MTLRTAALPGSPLSALLALPVVRGWTDPPGML